MVDSHDERSLAKRTRQPEATRPSDEEIAEAVTIAIAANTTFDAESDDQRERFFKHLGEKQQRRDRLTLALKKA